jgi:trehalose 6-phosphate synthase/phosphatase
MSSDPPFSADNGGGRSSRPLIVVSNRLPVQLQLIGSEWNATPTGGGLVAALADILKDQSEGSLWIGWPGRDVPERARAEARASLAAQGMVPVFLTQGQEERYYQGMCNDVLWPLFHYFADKVSYRPSDWAEFVAVNRAFANAILEVAHEEHRIWIHDFHLMLVPGMLRVARPDLEIGFFLHVPWPSSELYRLLPPRKELLRGILGADYVGFHTSDYARHFQFSCLGVLGLESEPDGIVWDNRLVGIGRHPIGINVERFSEVMASDETRQQREELRERYRGKKLLLGVERLDYTKGILLKLEAFEALLAKRPDLANEVVLLQIVVPSRLTVRDYQVLKGEIEEKIGQINGRYGRPGSTPIEYIYRSVSREQLVALYQVADVALVTPMRDGMNLVAQEFVFCQQGQRGMLVLSEFAGAAQGLSNALLVNPWNLEETTSSIEQALEMERGERDECMNAMAERVAATDCRSWAAGFLAKLATAGSKRRKEQAEQLRRQLTGELRENLLARTIAAPARVLLLDYDGTLQDIQLTPEKARPSGEILDLLDDLSRLEDTEVHLVSGRQAEVLERWFDTLGDRIHMCAEHGSMFRPAGGTWESTASFDLGWKAQVVAMLQETTAEVPGTFVEDKKFSVAWHYRNSETEQGRWAASGLTIRLENELQHMGVEIIQGHRVIEVRPAAANKGNYVGKVTEGLAPGTLVLCFGDDTTDMDMYRALPPSAVGIHVGSFVDNTDYYLESPWEVRSLLRELVAKCQAATAR